MYFDYQKTFTKWKVGEKTFGPVYYLVLRSMLFKILNTLHLQIPDIRLDKNLKNCQTQISEILKVTSWCPKFSKLFFLRYIKHSLVKNIKSPPHCCALTVRHVLHFLDLSFVQLEGRALRCCRCTSISETQKFSLRGELCVDKRLLLL